MSSRTSSRSTRTTVPVTMAPSSTDTRVASTASAKLPLRSSSTIWRGVYPDSALTSPSVAAGAAVESVVWASDTNRSAFFGGRDRRTAGPTRSGTATKARSMARLARVAAGPGEPLRTRSDHEELRRIDCRRVRGVRARRHRPDRAHREPGASRQQPELAGREARGPQLGGRSHAALVADLGVLVVDAGGCVEAVGVLEPTHLEVRREPRHGGDPARPQRPRDAAQHRGVGVEGRGRPAGQTEGALAQRDGGIELRVEPQVARVGAHEAGAGRRARAGDVDEPLADVDADHLQPPLCERVRVPARPAADIEDPLARLEA